MIFDDLSSTEDIQPPDGDVIHDLKISESVGQSVEWEGVMIK